MGNIQTRWVSRVLIAVSMMLSVCAQLLVQVQAQAQSQETRILNDVSDLRDKAYALTHAKIFVSPDQVLEDATLLIRLGRVVSVKQRGQVPVGYKTIDLSGKVIYPGLVDMASQYGMPEVPASVPFSFTVKEQIESATAGAYNANETIRSHIEAVKLIKFDAEAAKSLRQLGFSTVLSVSKDGIARGTSTLVTLGADRINDAIVVDHVATQYAFNKGSSKQSFPFSTMGAVALLRQTYLDAKWYEGQNPRPFSDLDLDAWIEHGDLPKIFKVRHWREALVAGRVAKEFDDQYILMGNGDEYQRIDRIKANDNALIVPINFPKPQDLAGVYETRHMNLGELKHWEMAPYNPMRLAEAGIEFALTSSGSGDAFWVNLRRAVKLGLNESVALSALTEVPAKLLNVTSDLGSLKPGRLANFIVTSGNLFDKGTLIYDNWIRGQRYAVTKAPEIKLGQYLLTLGDQQLELRIEESDGKLFVISESDDKKTKMALSVDGGSLSTLLKIDSETYRLRGFLNVDRWQGLATTHDGQQLDFSFSYQTDIKKDSEKIVDSEEEKPEVLEPSEDLIGELTYPLTAYGWKTEPAQQKLIIRGATVWTNEDEGILTQTDVKISGGKIESIGRDLTAKGYVEIDGRGQHLTPGIIDEHSHIALSGVNDIATNSSMVRMSDVVNSEDVAIYRALAGGVTAAQLLHGSANPIGGQSALIKLRWGSLPEDMLIENADGFIKFALGENVKRSRNAASVRYPQTRMGVEQVFTDAFTRAREYEQRWATFNKLSRSARRKANAPRRDLAMDVMLEVLNGSRYVTSHSYLQSEINMLMKVAERFEFNINTFTHILEGYKVADKMAAHGVGGSTFADWWAYKWEVRYAIPYNAALMHKAGVVTAINSDDAEMGRRLNHEAAKTMKYGDLTEQEALKLVTLNPAKLLHLDDKMGSIKPGKDADLVLWSDHPLSVYAKVNQTLVDGRLYFDRRSHETNTERNRLEKMRLIHKMQQAKQSEGKDK